MSIYWSVCVSVFTRLVSCVSIIKLCTCFSAFVSSSFLATTATTNAVQPAPCERQETRSRCENTQTCIISRVHMEQQGSIIDNKWRLKKGDLWMDQVNINPSSWDLKTKRKKQNKRKEGGCEVFWAKRHNWLIFHGKSREKKIFCFRKMKTILALLGFLQCYILWRHAAISFKGNQWHFCLLGDQGETRHDQKKKKLSLVVQFFYSVWKLPLSILDTHTHPYVYTVKIDTIIHNFAINFFQYLIFKNFL